MSEDITHGAVLIVDDDERIRYAFSQVFAQQGMRTLTANDGLEAIEIVVREHPSAVIMDITMPRLDGLSALAEIKSRAPSIPVIMVTGFGTVETAIKAMQLGAFDYLTKPLDLARIRDVTRRAMDSALMPAAEINAPSESPGHELVGASPVMQELYKLIGAVSATPNTTTVLITGETGTGKELVARAIHAHGRNAGQPFVAFDCTALSETLLESELFGHEKGAFTGALARKAGRFEIAGDGTIFLDEIGNLPLPLQQKLLRVIQTRQYERVGGVETLPVRARFVAATNADLRAAVEKGTFREDLYFRFNVANIRVPTLRERMDDVPILADYFLRHANARLGKSIRGFSNDMLDQLKAYAYPGNVRELENLVERAVMLCHGDLISLSVLDELAPSATTRPGAVVSGESFHESREHAIDRFERDFVLDQLARHHGNVTAAAAASRMTRQNFQRLMTKHEIRAEKFRE